MAWIESHQSLSRHKKTLKTAGRLSVDRHKLIGHLHELWWWGIDNLGVDGHLEGLSAYEIAMVAEWDGDAGEFLDALIQAGFIDREGDELYLHDWYDYAGKLIEKREKERKRSEERRQSAKESAVRPKDDRRSTEQRATDDQEKTNGTVPNRTVPNQTKEKDTVPVEEIIDHLNAKTGKQFRSSSKATRGHINARWAEGYRLDDFKTVIDKKTAQWLGTDKEQYLRPATLFNSEKFDGYLNEPWKPRAVQARASPSPQGGLDPSTRRQLERALEEARADAAAAQQEGTA